MTVAVLSALKLVFVAFLFVFVWQVAKAVAGHLGGLEARSRRSAGSEVVFVKSETQAGLDFRVSGAVVVGRSAQADVLLDDPYASEFHMRFTAEGDRLVLHDLGSTNGTYVNGRRVAATVTLNKGDAVQVGKTVMEVR